MYSMVYTAMIHGIDSRPVEVETDVSDGMPVFEMVGICPRRCGKPGIGCAQP